MTTGPLRREEVLALALPVVRVLGAQWLHTGITAMRTISAVTRDGPAPEIVVDQAALSAFTCARRLLAGIGTEADFLAVAEIAIGRLVLVLGEWNRGVLRASTGRDRAALVRATLPALAEATAVLVPLVGRELDQLDRVVRAGGQSSPSRMA